MLDNAIIQQGLATNVTFPEVVAYLSKHAIERYYTDLFNLQKTFYTANGETGSGKLVITNMPKVAEHFNESALKQALKLVIELKIDYPQFLRDIAAAGVATYTAYLTGKKVIYCGRKGECYIEHFPE